MENITQLKNERKLTKQLASFAANISMGQIAAWIMCFILSRASFFEVIKPFATAFYVAIGFTGFSKAAAIFSIALGSAVFSSVYECIRQVLALLLFEAFTQIMFKIGMRKESGFNRAVLISLLIFFTGILKGLIQGFHLYDLVVSILSAALVFSFTVIMTPASDTFHQVKQKLFPDGRMLFAKAALLCAAVISLKGLMVWECELGSMLAYVAVLILARRRGFSAGACAGVVLGMIVALYDLPASLDVPGMLALAGAAAGLPVKTRTAGVCLWTAVIILFSGLSVLKGGLILQYYEALAAGILFLLIPQPLLNRLSDGLAGIRGGDEFLEIHHSGITKESADQLFILSKAFSRISRNIESFVTEENEEEVSVTHWIIETVAENICNRCSMRERCWGTNFLKTYRLVEKSISDFKTDESGQIEIPVWFKNTCSKSDKFFEDLGIAYSLYKMENICRSKLQESRIQLARQADLASAGVMTIARKVAEAGARDYEVENRLLAAAGSSGIPVSGIRYHQEKESRPFLEVIFESKSKFRVKDLDDMVKGTIQADLIRMGEGRRDMLGNSVVRYMKQPKFKTATGVARASRQTGMVSGDSFTFFISSEGHHICAVSDGTGSGKKAERYSRTAIQMLENLIEDGVELSLAIRLMNMYLNIRGENERLATMDICAIDLCTGEVHSYKYGAPASFIRRSEGVSAVDTEIGESDGGTVSHFKSERMTAGDFVIVVSDGVLEAFSQKGEVTGLQWFIEKLETTNAQQLADCILEEALERLPKNHDDMTVLVTRLW